MPLCKFCIHLNPVNAERCAKCGAWISADPEPVAEKAMTGAAAPARPVEQAIDVAPLPDSVEPADDLSRHIRDLMARGQKIEAIRVYRSRTNASLKDAKDYVEKLGAGTAKADDGPDSQLLRLLRANRKIDAIKRYREQSGVGLKEAKDYVEALAVRHGIKSQSGCSTAAAILFACGAGVVWWAIGW